MATSPGAAFLAGFQTFDQSNRDWERIALAQQQQARQFAQQAVENKKERQAQDFNQMLALLKRGDANSQFGRENQRLLAGQKSQNILGDYNAQTSRMSAATSRINQQLDARKLSQSQAYNDDPLGLPELAGMHSGSTEPPLPSIPNIDDPKGGPLFNFGGKTYGQDWGPTTATVFGGSNDPEDNGLSAFGGPTGAGGREGIAIPAKVFQQTLGGTKADWERAGAEVSLADGTKKVLPVADLGTAERIWQRNGPTADLTPGAVDYLGGTVIRDRNGQQAGVQLPSPITNVRVVPDYRQASASPPDLSFAPASAASVVPNNVPPPSGNWAGLDSIGLDAPLPSPESLSLDGTQLPAADTAQPELPISFSDTDLSAPISRQLTALRRDSEMLKLQEQQATNMARVYQSQVRGIRNPVNKAAYQDRAQQAQAAAIQTRVQQAEAEAVGKQLSAQESEVRKRQEDIGKLSALGMDRILPAADVQVIAAQAGDPLGGGITEQRVKTLTAYDEVRKEQGLNYPSNGYLTAEKVAVAGKQLEKARDDMKAFDKFQSLQGDLAAAGDDFKKKAKIDTEMRAVKPAAERWQRLKTAFDQAVRADVRVDPNAPAAPAPAQATTAQAAAGPPADDLKSRADALRTQRKAMTPEEQRKWSEAKDAIYKFLGGDDAVVSQMADYGSVDSLSAMKRFINVRLRAEASKKSGEDAYGFLTGLKPSAVGLSQLPMNASDVEDVGNALAEDLWTKKMGRSPTGKAIPSSPGVPADDRSKAKSYLESDS